MNNLALTEWEEAEKRRRAPSPFSSVVDHGFELRILQDALIAYGGVQNLAKQLGSDPEGLQRQASEVRGLLAEKTEAAQKGLALLSAETRPNHAGKSLLPVAQRADHQSAQLAL